MLQSTSVMPHLGVLECCQSPSWHNNRRLDLLLVILSCKIQIWAIRIIFYLCIVTEWKIDNVRWHIVIINIKLQFFVWAKTQDRKATSQLNICNILSENGKTAIFDLDCFESCWLGITISRWGYLFSLGSSSLDTEVQLCINFSKLMCWCWTLWPSF